LTVLGAALGSGALGATSVTQPSTVELPRSSDLGIRVSIDGVTGSGEWIEVESFSWGVTQTGAFGGGGGGGAGKAQFQDLMFTSHLTEFSALIAKNVATGTHVKTVVLEDFSTETRRSNETVYLKITLSDCLITSYQVGGSAGDSSLPMESISISYAKIQYSYNPKGERHAGNSTSFGWDLEEGKAV
jgi:type VI secretion system secreted protein Hcp